MGFEKVRIVRTEDFLNIRTLHLTVGLYSPTPYERLLSQYMEPDPQNVC